MLICTTNLIVCKDYDFIGVFASSGLAQKIFSQIILRLLKGRQCILIGPGWKVELVLTTSMSSLFEHVGNVEWIDYHT